MLIDQIMELFKDEPEAVRRVISDVIRLEQEHITDKRPRLKEPIRRIIERMADDAT